MKLNLIVKLIKSVLILLPLSLLILTFQNCSNFNAGQNGSVSSNSTAPTTPQNQFNVRAGLLNCSEAEKELATGDKISYQQQINALGRISNAGSRLAGFITKDRRLHTSRGLLADVRLTDLNYLYKWFNFSSRCGVTDENTVRCIKNDNLTYEDIPELSGSLQVIADTNRVCGLQVDKSLKCLNSTTKTMSVVNAPAPILLIYNNLIFDENKVTYFLDSNLNFIIYDNTPDILLNTSEPRTYNRNIVPVCGLNIIATSFKESDNYTSDRGCVLTDTGQIACIETLNIDGKKQFFSANSKGSYTTVLKNAEPTSRYLAITNFGTESKVCGVRDDSEIVCFSTKPSASLYNTQISYQVDYEEVETPKIENAGTVKKAVANKNKTCILKNKEAFCWKNPIVDELGSISQIYKIQTTEPISELIDIFEMVENNTQFFRACFLTESQKIICDSENIDKTFDGSVFTFADTERFKKASSGNFYGQLNNLCAINTNDQLRCTNFVGKQENWVLQTVASNVVMLRLSYYLTAESMYGNTHSSGVQKVNMTFKSTIPNHPDLFIATDNQIYYMSSTGPFLVSAASFSVIENLRYIGNGQYINNNQNQIILLTQTEGTKVYDFSNLYGSAVPPIFNYVYYDPNNIFISNDGYIFSRYDQRISNYVNFWLPTVMTLNL